MLGFSYLNLVCLPGLASVLLPLLVLGVPCSSARPRPLLSPLLPPPMDSKKRKVQENGDQDLAPQDVRSLIEPFAKEQLLDILQDVAIRHRDVLDEVRKLADKDPAHRKLFVRGIGRDTTTEAVKSVFLQFGEVDEAVVVVDKASGKNKGYGFVTFMHADGARRALKDPNHKIDGRITICHLASLGNVGVQSSQDQAERKVYVGNVSLDLTADALLSVFSKYGEIEGGPFGFDKQTGKSRGYAIFVYKTVESAKRALEEPFKVVDGHQVHCKLAASGESQKKTLPSQGQSEVVDLAALQAAGAASSLPYAAANTSALAGALSLTPGINLSSIHPALAAQGLHSGLSSNQSLAVQQLTSSGQSLPSSLNSSLPSSLYSSLAEGGSYGLTQSLGQGQSSLSLASLGLHGLGAYGAHTPQSAYGVGASLYGLPSSSVASQSGILQGASGGHHTLASLKASQLTRGSGSRLDSLSSYY